MQTRLKLVLDEGLAWLNKQGDEVDAHLMERQGRGIRLQPDGASQVNSIIH